MWHHGAPSFHLEYNLFLLLLFDNLLMMSRLYVSPVLVSLPQFFYLFDNFLMMPRVYVSLVLIWLRWSQFPAENVSQSPASIWPGNVYVSLILVWLPQSPQFPAGNISLA